MNRQSITHRNNSQDSVSLSIPQQDVNEGNDLQCLAKPHAVSEDATKTTAALVTLQRLNQVIIQKPDAANLGKRGVKKCHIDTLRGNASGILAADEESTLWTYLVRFDSLGQLWREINVLLLRRVVDINQHAALGVRQVQSIVDVRSTALLCAGGATVILLIARLTAYLQGVLVPRAEFNYICAINKQSISACRIYHISPYRGQGHLFIKL